VVKVPIFKKIYLPGPIRIFCYRLLKTVETKDKTNQQDELDDDDRVYITGIFFEVVVAKLKKMDARIGTLNCDFAGEQYRNWNIHFKSTGSDFEIVDFEYDEDSYGFSLDP
jgi:hypothetical protein